MRGGLLILALFLVSAGPAAQQPGTLPTHLADADFWKLSEDLSEPAGFFQSDNLVSNEVSFQSILDSLSTRVRRRAVYIGVGPEQNFTYIAAVDPKVAFIVDIRRGNLQLQLLYKALFELSLDRESFVARLFGRAKGKRLAPGADATALFSGMGAPAGSLESHLQPIIDVLVRKHHLPLSNEDLPAIRSILQQFHRFGPDITYGSTSGRDERLPNYRQLMMTVEGSQQLSFLSSADRYEVVRDLQVRNLIVPVVGNLAGLRALRAVGQYVREHGETLGAMYVSNVEEYLRRDGSWRAFCLNVRTMPMDAQTVLIRSASVTAPIAMTGLVPYIASMMDDVRACGN